MALLTPHFSDSELGNPPAQYVPNALRTAQMLETIRAVLGVPLRVTSGYRSEADNLRVGGARNSGHLTASAADFVPRGMSVKEVARRLDDAKRQGQISYGELIIYESTGHIHVTLPGVGGDGETFVKLASGGTSTIAAFLGGGGAAVALLFAVVIFALRRING